MEGERDGDMGKFVYIRIGCILGDWIWEIKSLFYAQAPFRVLERIAGFGHERVSKKMIVYIPGNECRGFNRYSILIRTGSPRIDGVAGYGCGQVFALG